MGSDTVVYGSAEGRVGAHAVDAGTRITEAKEGRTSVRLKLCYVAFQEDDGSFWEDWCARSLPAHFELHPPP